MCHSAQRVASKILKIAEVTTLLCAALVLLTFPIPRYHQTTNHFHAPEIRRTVVRNVILERTTNDASDRISASQALLAGLPVADTEDEAKSFEEFAETSDIPLTRLLLRLKLGPAGSAIADPLL